MDEPPEVSSVWNATRMGIWSVALAVGSTCAGFHYILLTEGGGPLLVAVIGGSIFWLPFLGLVAWRLHVTPDPVPEMDYRSGSSFRMLVIDSVQLIGKLFNVLIFFDCLWVGEWPGMITSVWWMIWLSGMATRERARACQLAEEKPSAGS